MKIFDQDRQIIELQILNDELNKKLKNLHFDALSPVKNRSFMYDDQSEANYEDLNENTQTENQNLNNYMNSFKVGLNKTGLRN